MSSLLALIRDIVKKDGPMSLAQYMELALQHPEFGYYRHGDPLGASGDFVTAPEISQMFGEMIGLWCADVWRMMGNPKRLVLFEMGPGRGTLLQDAMRATEKIAGFHEALDLCLLESNATLRKVQAEKLTAYLPRHIENIGDLPSDPTLVIANEFFDALPIRQFESTFQGWCERLVTVESDSVAFTPWPLDPVFSRMIPDALRSAPPGTIHEVSLSSLSFMRDIAKHLATHSGAGLIIDYGYVDPPGRGTLQAVINHRSTGVLEQPGDADLTAHVDFAALRKVGSMQDVKITGPIGQADFLQTLGIDLRANQLKQHATPEQVKDLDDAIFRLTDTSQMGSLFKVMVVTSKNLAVPPGF